MRGKWWGSHSVTHTMKYVIHRYSPENRRLVGGQLICKAVIFSGKHSSLFYLLKCTSVIQIHVLTFVMILPVYKKLVPLTCDLMPEMTVIITATESLFVFYKQNCVSYM